MFSISEATEALVYGQLYPPPPLPLLFNGAETVRASLKGVYWKHRNSR